MEQCVTLTVSDDYLVLTGGTSREEASAARKPRPIAVADNLAALVNGDG